MEEGVTTFTTDMVSQVKTLLVNPMLSIAFRLVAISKAPKGSLRKGFSILFLEIWTNGSLTPKEALHEASRHLIELFIPFLHAKEEKLNLENKQHKVTLPLFTFHDRLAKLKKNQKEIALKSIFIDQSELPPRIYNCLKRSNIHTLRPMQQPSTRKKEAWELLPKNFRLQINLTRLHSIVRQEHKHVIKKPRLPL
ncbi:hypothetical protein CIPAW_07G080400 [Carya illinoinensis]|uniref:RNA polymerase alpha subunit n=1 Tax=Carya illinoinensis TaxID=32201 RepID=A0A8T1Q0Y0_CARIL|nr:hypothetical protein CIPAW_07G080400 [Carya illinoinensis]